MLEKGLPSYEPPQVHPTTPPDGKGGLKRIVLRCGVALLAFQLVRLICTSEWPVNVRYQSQLRTHKSWRSGKPIYRTKNSTIGWHVCPDNPKETKFLCSTHKVPMNWLDPVEGEDVEIFLRMLPADDDKRQGSLLVNPGGPGGSGNALVYGAGPGLSVITERKLDIVGFDPRGINMTTPRLKMFDSAYDAALFDDRNPFMGLAHDPSHPVNLSSSHELQRELSHYQHMEDLAKLRADRVKRYTTEAARKSVSTPFVVRDMVSLVDALGEKDGLLTYWGFSYGTILGAHFAAMMPDRVGRMVLDGVSHAGDYTNSLFDWAWSSMTDTQKVLQEFANICSSVGPLRCSLATAPNSSTVRSGDEIVDHVNELRKELWERPVMVETEDGVGFVGGQELETALFQTLYSPSRWSKFANSLSSLPNGTLLHSLVPTPSLQPSHLLESTKSDTDNVFGMPLGSDGASMGILCGDSNPTTKGGLEEWVRFGEKLGERSPNGDSWMHLVLSCRGWNDRPYERYEGPWDVKEGLRKTRNKVLWIGNTFDNVTPLRSAIRMKEGFGNESGVLLEHGGHGHCSVAEPSLCTIKSIRDYLVNGIIPEDGKYCPTEEGYIFPPSSGCTEAGSKVQLWDDDKEEKELMDAIKRVARALLD